MYTFTPISVKFWVFCLIYFLASPILVMMHLSCFIRKVQCIDHALHAAYWTTPSRNVVKLQLGLQLRPISYEVSSV